MAKSRKGNEPRNEKARAGDKNEKLKTEEGTQRKRQRKHTGNTHRRAAARHPPARTLGAARAETTRDGGHPEPSGSAPLGTDLYGDDTKCAKQKNINRKCRTVHRFYIEIRPHGQSIAMARNPRQNLEPTITRKFTKWQNIFLSPKSDRLYNTANADLRVPLDPKKRKTIFRARAPGRGASPKG